jgi:outer membrane lipoprotein-sorting protein
MIMKPRIVTSWLVAACSSTVLHASQLSDRFHQTYSTLRSLSCTFTESSGIKGSIAAMRGGKYDVRLPDRRLVSDGSTVWNVTPSSKTVILDRYRTNADDLSIERIFFTLMAVYRIQREEKLTSTGRTILRLVPPADNALVGGVAWADVTIDAKMNVHSITINDGTATSRWTITGLKRNPSLSPSAFSFKPASGWQVIDLR